MTQSLILPKPLNRTRLTRSERKALPDIDRILTEMGISSLPTQKVEQDKWPQLQKAQGTYERPVKKREPRWAALTIGMLLLLALGSSIDFIRVTRPVGYYILVAYALGALGLTLFGLRGQEVTVMQFQFGDSWATWEKCYWKEYISYYPTGLPKEALALALRVSQLPHCALYVHYIPERCGYLEIRYQRRYCDQKGPEQRRYLIGW